MSARKLLSITILAGLISAIAACADVTAPQQQTGFCTVTGGGQVCTPD
jgi:hypothetical protein